MKKPTITIDGKEVTDVQEIDEALSCSAPSAGGVELTTGEQAMDEITKRFSELVMKGRKMNRPPNRPTCKHGNTPGRCDDCNREQIRIEKEVKPGKVNALVRWSYYRMDYFFRHLTKLNIRCNWSGSRGYADWMMY